MVNGRASWRRRIIGAAWVVLIGGFALVPPSLRDKFAAVSNHLLASLVNQQERFLCFEIDHAIVAENLRTFADQQNWAEAGFDKNDPRIPAALRVLKPSAIFVHPEYVALDFGGPFFEMDIRSIQVWPHRRGHEELADGLWFYAEDGSYPLIHEPFNRSQRSQFRKRFSSLPRHPAVAQLSLVRRTLNRYAWSSD